VQQNTSASSGAKQIVSKKIWFPSCLIFFIWLIGCDNDHDKSPSHDTNHRDKDVAAPDTNAAEDILDAIDIGDIRISDTIDDHHCEPSAVQSCPCTVSEHCCPWLKGSITYFCNGEYWEEIIWEEDICVGDEYPVLCLWSPNRP
jgi:hypothetical protein